MARWAMGVCVWILLVIVGPVQAAPVSTDPEADAGTTDPPEPSAPAIPADRLPTLALSVSPKEVSVGEVVHWRLAVTRHKEDRVHLSSGASFGAFEVLSKDVTQGDAKSDGDWIEEVLHVQLIGFDPADITIPAQKLTVVDAQGRIGEVETETADVTINSLIANEPEPELKQDQGPGEQVFEKDYTLLWILGIIAGAGIVALITLLIRRLWAMRRPRPGPPPPPPRPAHEIALEKLEALARSTLLANGEVKEFHVRLSEAIREYLGNRYGFESLERSTEELVHALKRTGIGREDLERTVAFLEETDLVKFAKMIPTLEESNTLLDKSIEFVNSTTPTPMTSSEKAGTEPQPTAPAGGSSDA
ncbi:MAG: hypothetical protein QNJ97_21455 [Myxococcota bacterium]|nr:hypothetical protein [Myxococcota bacterium]